MPYFANLKELPAVVRLGTEEHTKAVQLVYRRYLKWSKSYLNRFNHTGWDCDAYFARQYFEQCRTMTDPGEIKQVMDEAIYALKTFEDTDMFFYPWDGPQSNSWQRFKYLPKKAFDWKPQQTDYDWPWRDKTTDEYYTKQECKKWQARFMTILREETLHCRDYPTWLITKKRLEEELQVKYDEIMKSMHQSMWDYYMDFPYNIVPEFSDGWKPDANLDIAFQQHWDEDMWKYMAQLTEKDIEAVRQYDWDLGDEQKSSRANARLLPPPKDRTRNPKVVEREERMKRDELKRLQEQKEKEERDAIEE